MRNKNKIITVMTCLFVMILVTLSFALSDDNNATALPITQTISGNTQQRTVTIYEPEIGRTAIITLAQQRRLVIRQRTDELPQLPRQQVLYGGEGLKIYRVGGLLVIVELETNRRHYI